MDQFPFPVAEESVMEKGFSWVQWKASGFTYELMSLFITTSMLTQQEVKASSAQENWSGRQEIGYYSSQSEKHWGPE